MRFLSLYKPGKDPAAAPLSGEKMAEIVKFTEEMFKTGNLISTEGCNPGAKGARVRISGGKFGVTDGPFTEAKEMIGGLAMLKAESREEAIDLVKQFLKVMGEGECELLQMYEPSDCPAQAGPNR